jgi:hypothetical protein
MAHPPQEAGQRGAARPLGDIIRVYRERIVREAPAGHGVNKE